MRNLKIHIIQNNISKDYSKDFERVKDYFKRKANIDISFTFAKTNFKVETDFYSKLQNGTTFGTAQNIQNKVTCPTGTRVTVFMFREEDTNALSKGWTVTSNTMRAEVNGSKLCNIVCKESDVQYDWFYNSVIHEIMHTFAMMVSDLGISFRDEMDMTEVNGQLIQYWNNHDPEASLGNFARCFKNLEPYWSRIFPEQASVVITRKKDTGKQTLGKLVATNNGATFTCDTLELSWKNNEKNISCIPTGTYEVKHTFSPRFMKYTYEIQKVPNRSGIRVHVANYYTQLNGCIALGVTPKDINKDGQLDVLNSRNTIKSFEQFMGKKPFKLLIK